MAAGVFVLCALGAHAGLVLWTPREANAQVWQFLSGGGQLVNAWFHSPRQTPETAGAVHAAPELSYSTCAIDLSQGPVRLRAGAWEPYMSMALYDATGFNFYVVNDLDMSGDRVDVLLVPPGQAAAGAHELRAPTVRVAAIIRRLVPSEDAWTQVAVLQAGDECGSVAAGAAE